MSERRTVLTGDELVAELSVTANEDYRSRELSPKRPRASVQGVLAREIDGKLKFKPFGGRDWINILPSQIVELRVLSQVAQERAYVCAIEVEIHDAGQDLLLATLLGAGTSSSRSVIVPDSCIDPTGRRIHLVSSYGGLLFAFELQGQNDRFKHLAHGPGVTTADGRWSGVPQAYGGWLVSNHFSPSAHLLQFECEYAAVSGAWLSHLSDLNGGAAALRSKEEYDCYGTRHFVLSFDQHSEKWAITTGPNQYRYLCACPPQGVSKTGEVRWVDRFSGDDCLWAVSVDQ